MKESAELLYSLYTDSFIELVNSEEFYSLFMNAVKSGTGEFSLAQRYTENKVDVKWVEAIEEAIIPLDNIVRNPRRFIEQVEEIVPIEQARRITQESIRHLAQHTSMIAKVEDDGMVTPDRILNIYKEESFATYENRFIYTLLQNLQYFIDKRLKAMQEARVQAISRVSMNNQFQVGKEKLQYSMSMTSTHQLERDKSDLEIDADTSRMDMLTRIERLRKILYDFQASPLINALKGCTLVKPPIMRTNVLLKNPDFKQAMKLWQFIETYRDAGFAVELVENEELPSENYMAQLYSILAVNYCLLNHHTKTNEELELTANIKKEHKPLLIRKTIEEYVNDISFDIDNIQKIFVHEIKRSSKKRQEDEEKIKRIIDRALLSEHNRKEKIKEEQKLLAEKEKQRKLKEAERLKLLKQKEKAKLEKKKKREREKLKRSQQKEREKLKQKQLQQKKKV